VNQPRYTPARFVCCVSCYGDGKNVSRKPKSWPYPGAPWAVYSVCAYADRWSPGRKVTNFDPNWKTLIEKKRNIK
jgi:hypothetical protein